MKFTISKRFSVFLLTGLFFIGCGNQEQAGSENSPPNSNRAAGIEANRANIPKDDAEELGKIVRLPFEPEEVVYKPNIKPAANANTAAAPDAKKLIAVLKFSKEDADKIAEQAAVYKPPVALDVDAESWFPAELIAQSQLSGDDVLKGKSYAANDFIQPPYTTGKITRIDDTDYFVLELIAV